MAGSLFRQGYFQKVRRKSSLTTAAERMQTAGQIGDTSQRWTGAICLAHTYRDREPSIHFRGYLGPGRCNLSPHPHRLVVRRISVSCSQWLGIGLLDQNHGREGERDLKSPKRRNRERPESVPTPNYSKTPRPKFPLRRPPSVTSGKFRLFPAVPARSSIFGQRYPPPHAVPLFLALDRPARLCKIAFHSFSTSI
jgi:hypothetical protein